MILSLMTKKFIKCLKKPLSKKLPGATILLVTHDAFAASFCKRILFIKDGLLFREISKTGTRKEFYDDIIDVFSELGGDTHDLR